MRLCNVRYRDGEDVGIRTQNGLILLSAVNRITGSSIGPTLLDIITGEQVGDLRATLTEIPVERHEIPLEDLSFGPPYRNPPKLWGVGLNFRSHAEDLEVKQPVGAPGSYFRPNSTIIGPGDDILLPSQSQRVTAEAELAVVIGKTCRDVAPEEAESVVFGFTTVLDMTAEDVIRVNPRHIPWAKAFDTFCSFGPWVVTPDEIGDLSSIRVSTIVNGQTIATHTVAAMMCDPHWLIAYFSGGMVLEAGSIICTGTPGAGVIRDGDTVEARVNGVGTLHNQVKAAVPAAI